MSFTTRLCVFALIAGAAIVAWHCSAMGDASQEATQLAVQQFQNDDAVSANLQQASLAQNYWPLLWPALVLMVGAVMFWEDAERWWKQEDVQ
jgi:hypothetical protein